MGENVMLNDEIVLKRISDASNFAKNVQEELNAMVTFVDYNDQLENMNMHKSGKMFGVPIVLKDNVNTKGIKTTASSKMLENYVPIYDATIVTKLKNAGAIIIGKSSMDELAMGGTNLTAATGSVKNPYDTNRMSGGSSGGSASLVGKGVVTMAIGSDTGDSIRKPAAFCGCVGLKPTYGRISRYGIIPYSSSLDHVGCFTGSVKDAAIALEVLAGRDDLDMTSSYEPVDNYSEFLSGDIKGKKIAILKNVTDNISNVDVLKCFDESIEKLKQQGAIVEEVILNEKLMLAILPTYYLIANCEATANHANLNGICYGNQVESQTSEQIMIKSRTNGFGPLIRKRFVIGSYGLFVENQEKLFKQAQKVRRLIVEEYDKVLKDFDFVCAPASASIAPLLDDKHLDQLSDEYLVAENHMIISNFTGYPSITVPMGFVDKMPVGINFTAHKFDEGNLLNLAYTHELCNDFKVMKAGN